MFTSVILAAILSSIVYGIALPIESNHVYVAILYSLPIFLVAGFLVTILVDRLMKKLNILNTIYRYSLQLISYALAGLVAAIIIAVLNQSLSELALTPLALFGILPALIYFHFYLAITYLFSRYQIFET